MQGRKSVQVLVPHYNDANGLRLSLESLALQTFSGPMVVTILDDGSSIAEFSAVKGLCSSFDLDIQLIRRIENEGLPSARNALLRSICCDYVTWLDAGDIFFPQKIDLQVAEADRILKSTKNKHFWVLCDYSWSEAGKCAKQVKQDIQGDLLKALLVGQRLRAYLWTVLGPAETFSAVGEFDHRLQRLQDLDYFIRFILTRGVLWKVGSIDCDCFPLCEYKKSFNRSSRKIWSAREIIHKKYRAVYQVYGERFRRRMIYRDLKHASRFAIEESDRDFLNFLNVEARRVRYYKYLYERFCKLGVWQ